MPFRFTPTSIPGVIVIEPRVFFDERGCFMEGYKRSEFAAAGIDTVFVQCNRSKSSKWTLRGLHYQKHPKAQHKLVWAASGEIYDVVVDLRHGAPTYGKWLAEMLSSENRKMLYVPAGFAHGFCVTSDEADVMYLATEEYAPDLEAGVIWNDGALGIHWPTAEPRVSDRDSAWPYLQSADNNFHYFQKSS
jgi:dTDP-4-dehydrorhamnose 3,5-epimerase